jgi:hypothetical protein
MRNLLLALIVIGILCLGLGVYLLLRKPNEPATTVVSTLPSPTPQKPKSVISIPFMSFGENQWDEYGTKTDFPAAPPNVYMRSIGYVIYPFTASPQGDAVVTVKLASELNRDLEGHVGTNPAYSSDVTFSVNDTEISTQNIIPDDTYGKMYTWTIPGNLIQEHNTLKLEIKPNAKHRNGITIFSPFTIRFK